MDEVEAWVAEKCGAHGAIERVAVPRLECNWDPGWGFVTFASEEAAEAARASLDGTPGPVDGCNLFVEYEEIREMAADGASARAVRDRPSRPPVAGLAFAAALYYLHTGKR